MEKTNAKDYLIEFATDKDSWQKALIYEALSTNGNISEDKLNEVYTAFINSNEVELPTVVDNSANEGKRLSLIKLKHNQGVNAVQNNQIIKFSEDITILYGMNGVGKSSYFKVLNEIVGGSIPKEIKPNIYTEAPVDIDIDVEYKIDGNNTTITGWNGTERSIDILNQSCVFDTSYQNGLLTKHNVDDLLLEPLGLNLFKYIADIFGDFKERLKTDIKEKTENGPQIDDQSFSEEVKLIFRDGIVTDQSRQKVESYYSINDDDINRICEIGEELSKLKQVNIQDKITLHKNIRDGIEKVKEDLKKIEDELSGSYDSVKKLCVEYADKKSINDEALQRIDILNGVPGTDTEAWKSFIESGKEYSNSKEINDQEICPYCWQPLDSDKAISTLKAYSSFLSDNSESELKKVNLSIEKLLEDLKAMQTDVELPAFLRKKLDDTKIDDITLSTGIERIVEKQETLRNVLIESLESKTDVCVANMHNKESIDTITRKLEELVSCENEEIVKGNQSETEKSREIETLEKEKITLVEYKAIADQEDQIRSWFKMFDEVAILQEKEARLKTNAISRISKEAHENLLTTSLRDAFNTELKEIGFMNLDVELKSGGVSRGVASTRLLLKDIDAIETILSEGEQKAVALAMFIAEIRLQNNMCPIILDDPVNSLDHKISNTFAERLMKLDNQIVLFIHNKLFLDAFEATKENHICKTVDTTCNNNKGKHIKIYEVDSYGKFEKGVLRNYKGTKLKSLIDQAEKELRRRPFEEHYKVGVIIRRAVEAAIDEKLLVGIVPTKFSNKNSRIRWDDLKCISIDSDNVDRLKAIHSRVSGSEMHNGTEADENPIDAEEFSRLISEIKEISGIA